MHSRAATVRPGQRPRYLAGQPAPVVFPEEAEVPETQLHLDLRILLYQLLSDYLGLEATVGSDQFVYYAADDPRQSVAPDAYVKLGPRVSDVRTWKTWERGAPDVAVEIVSDSDASHAIWEDKLARYRRLGVRELVRFDPEDRSGVMRIWDRVNDTLQEREVTGTWAPSLVLPLTWVVAPADNRPMALRIAGDAEGEQLIPTRIEAREAEARAREAEARAREAEARARQAAEARVAELEAELLRRR